MTTPLGQPVALSVNVTDATGVAANATLVVLTVTAPDGSTATPSVTNPTTGTYTATFTPTLAGRHTVYWLATGSNASAFADEFNVTGTASGSVVSFADVKEYINSTNTVHDARLREYIDAATSMVTYRVGPIVPTTFSEVHDGGFQFIMLRRTPVISVTSIVEYVGRVPYPLTLQPLGSSVDNWGYSLSKTSGKVTRRDAAGLLTRFVGGMENIAVTYQAGNAVVDPEIRLAVMDDIKAMYQQSQGSALPSLDGEPGFDQFNGPRGAFFRLDALLRSKYRMPGIG